MPSKLSPTLQRLALTKEDKEILFSDGVRWDIHQPREPHGNAGPIVLNSRHPRKALHDAQFDRQLKKHFGE